jgi:tetrahydrodipicolinate N-succinyltransferase
VWFGAGVSVIGNIKIGHGCIIGAGSLVNKDIPPFSIAVGSPCKVIKRFDFLNKKWININEYSLENNLLIPDEAAYLERLKKLNPKINMPILATTKKYGNKA